MRKTKRCAAGIGKAITEELIARGDFVFGCDVSEQGLAALAQQFPKDFKGILLNVGDAQSVRAAAKALQVPEQGLDAIVNNAGVLRGGPLIELPDSVMQISLTINALGMVHVTKYFFPHLRRKLGEGRYAARIINIASEISYFQVSGAFNVPYAASKFAMEAISQGLRQEMLFLRDTMPPPHVVVVNPGAHETNMSKPGSALTGCDPTDVKSLYHKILPGFANFVQWYFDWYKQPPSLVATSVADAVHLYCPPYRICVNASMFMRCSSVMPQYFLDWGMIAFMNLLS